MGESITGSKTLTDWHKAALSLRGTLSVDETGLPMNTFGLTDPNPVDFSTTVGRICPEVIQTPAHAARMHSHAKIAKGLPVLLGRIRMGGSFHFEIYRGSAHQYAAASDERIWSAIDACSS
jgi:hypothetical protein